jgi:hypothetical protein
MTDPLPSKEWGSPEQVKFVIGFVKETKRQGYEMCPLHVDFLLAVLERAVPEPKPPHEREPPHCSTCGCGLAPEPGARPVRAWMRRFEDGTWDVTHTTWKWRKSDRSDPKQWEVIPLYEGPSQPTGVGNANDG